MRRFVSFSTLSAVALVLVAASPLPIAAHGQDEASSGLVLHAGWRSGPELESARAGLSAVAMDGHIYAAGGAGRVTPRDNFEVYDSEINRWRPLSPLPEGLERFGFAAADGRIWAAGGYSSESGREPIAEMWSYDPEMDVWQSETPMPAARAAFAMVAHEDRLYAVGGIEEPGGIFVFDIETREWAALDAPSDLRRRDAGITLVEGEIWVTGGIVNRRAVARVDIYNIDRREWRRGPDLPAARAGHALVFDGARLLALGGRGDDLRSTYATVFAIEPGARSWREDGSLTAARTEAAASVLDGAVFLIGGGVGGGVFAPFTALATVDVLGRGQ
ncbi:Kelch repeat-containing protein [Glycocaulis abyssi]|uniref:Kelch repeat-containing protein n=1 Tax=Glycocaulis abyssi TaxID=1433403 RepID=UPI00352B3D21